MTVRRNVNHKYGAKRTKLHGKNFPSKLEANVCNRLEQLKRSGEVLFYLWQVPIHIHGFKPHRVDFLVFTPDNAFFIEAKGKDLPEGKKMRELAEAEINCEIHLVFQAEEVDQVLKSQPVDEPPQDTLFPLPPNCS